MTKRGAPAIASFLGIVDCILVNLVGYDRDMRVLAHDLSDGFQLGEREYFPGGIVG